MKRLSLCILIAIFLCVPAYQAGANDTPRVLQGLELTDDQRLPEAEAAQIRGEAWSPNNFARGPNGYCTWYVDGRYKEATGWTIHFNKNSDRDAYKWWDRVDGFTKGSKKASVGKGQEGHKGDIMVINRWKDKDGIYRAGAAGHVAYVEQMQTNSKKWKISHANWKTGNATRYIEGKPIYEATTTRSGNNVVIGGAPVPLRGFLYRK
jgi:hypothetical protein